MAFIISDIRVAKPQSGHRYLFDTNIWLALLDVNFYRHEYKPYVNFFNSIINNTVVKDAYIVIPSLLLSELLNRLINDIYYEEFIISNTPLPNQSKREHFKKVYRPNPQYGIDIENACASIRDYHSKIEFVSDNLNEFTCKSLIKKIPTHLDINDYLYSKMALAQGLVIVTNDSDFKVEDVTVITSQSTLLALMPAV
jgi:predicted nucleic acid-binding protein